MSAGLKMLGSIQHIEDLSRFDLNPDLFNGEKELGAYQFVRGHVSKHGVLPSPATLQDEGLVFPTPEEPPSFYYEKLVERHTKLTMKKVMTDAADLINDGQYTPALAELKAMCLGLDMAANPNKIVDFAGKGFEIVPAAHQAMKLPGAEGLKLGWDTPDKMAGGFRGGDVLTIVGRPGAGKTYMMLYMAVQCWLQGKVPMFISMEMKPLPIMQRLAAIMTTLPVGDLMAGELPTTLYKHMLAELKKLTDQHPFHVVDGALAATIPDIVLQAQQFKPDFVLIDAAYLLRHENSRLSRWDRATENMEDMKSQLAESLDIPVACSHQLNREAEKKIKKGKKDELGVEDIAYTDAVGQISSLVMALLQAEDAQNNEIIAGREVTIMKGRNGETGSFDINWEFQNGPRWLDFSEKKLITAEELSFT